MNRQLITENTCEREGEILSYLYDDLADDGRAAFELHLADCQTCIDEFAAVSHARFAVFEWQREEFAAMPTPKIAIPYRTDGERVSTGLFDGFRRLLAFGSGPAVAFAAVAIVASLVIFGYMFRGSSADVAKNTGISTPPPAQRSDSLPTVTSVDTATVDPAKAPMPIVAARASVSTKQSRPNAAVHPIPATAARTTVANHPKANLPDRSLGDDDMDTDETLRLSDLFADEDTFD